MSDRVNFSMVLMNQAKQEAGNRKAYRDAVVPSKNSCTLGEVLRR